MLAGCQLTSVSPRDDLKANCILRRSKVWVVDWWLNFNHYVLVFNFRQICRQFLYAWVSELFRRRSNNFSSVTSNLAPEPMPLVEVPMPLIVVTNGTEACSNKSNGRSFKVLCGSGGRFIPSEKSKRADNCPKPILPTKTVTPKLHRISEECFQCQDHWSNHSISSHKTKTIKQNSHNEHKRNNNRTLSKRQLLNICFMTFVKWKYAFNYIQALSIYSFNIRLVL